MTSTILSLQSAEAVERFTKAGAWRSETIYAVDISAEQLWAENLLANNRLYRQTAARAGENKVASVLDDLERLLVEVASGPSQLTHEEAQAMRKRIEAGGLLFKVKVLGSQMRERERAAPRETPKTVS